MSKEFAEQFERYRAASCLSQAAIARGIACDPSYIVWIQSGQRNVTPRIALASADMLQIPVSQRARFYLRSAGYPEERILTALDCPMLRVRAYQPDGQEVSAGTYIKENMPGRFKSENELADAVKIHHSHINRLGRNTRLALPGVAESLIRILQIPSEDQAEFMLLIRGFPLQVTTQVLQSVDLKS
jgi:transcriptional regulator with XRE-family HTH domain